MRACWVLCAGVVAFSTGCADKEAADPGAVMREEIVNRIGPPSRATSRTVRCGCDADGGLHVRAPAGSQVTIPEDATQDAEAEVVLPEEMRGTPLRKTKSLGFIGDGKLGQSRTYGGPWNVPDALLPPHQHVEPRYGTAPGWGYRGAYRGPYIYGGTSWTGTARTSTGWGAGGGGSAPVGPIGGPGAPNPPTWSAAAGGGGSAGGGAPSPPPNRR